jgi:general nucleoside transport system ATP-binding protein
MEDPSPIVELRGITKRFPGVLACDRVDLDMYPGEIHALLGENGAGKTTLMTILYGLHQPDTGEIWIDGKRMPMRSPKDAIRAGIGMVFQHPRDGYQTRRELYPRGPPGDRAGAARQHPG